MYVYIPSAPDQIIRPANTVAKGFHLQFPEFILSRFNTFGISSFAAKDNFCLSRKLISVQLHTLVVPYTTND